MSLYEYFKNAIEEYETAMDALTQSADEQIMSFEELVRRLQEAFQELDDLACEKVEIRAAPALHAIAHTQHHRPPMTARIISHVAFSRRWYAAATGT